MKFPHIGIVFALLTAQPALAEVEGSSPLAASDEAAIDQLIEPAFTQLRAGQSMQALNAFFSTSQLMSGKTAELNAIASQINGAIAAYGEIGQCELVERQNHGSYVQARLYICQQANLATRWQFAMVKTSGGWIGANLNFDDRVLKALGE